MNVPTGRTPAPGAARDRLILTASLLVGALPALLLPGRIAEAGHGAVTLASGGVPNAHDRLLAFGIAPVVAVSAAILFLAPGLLVTRLAGDDGSRTDRWLVRSGVVSLVLVSLVATLGQWLVGATFRGSVFGWTLAALSAVLGLMGARQGTRDRVGARVAPGDETRTALVLAVLVPVALGVLLAPKLHWEAFNGDGVHAFESARLLLVHPVPFWSESAGAVAGFPGVTSMLYAYPTSWFLRLFGAVDAAARLPMLLYAPLLVSAIAWLIGAGRSDRREPLDQRLLLWAGVLVYVVVMAWSATYNPYAADIALPGTQDTLLLIVYVGFLAAFVERSWGWAAVLAALTYVSLPSGLILIAFWMVAIALAWRPTPWREVRWLLGLLLALVVGGALVPRLLAALSLPLPGREYGLVGILRYFAFLRLTDVGRLGWVAIASGIIPVAVTFLWSRQDRVARALSLVCGAYFLFFYVQANVSLHHFVPAMILPFAILWRTVPADGAARARWVAASVAGVVVSLVLAWPRHSAPHIDGRRVGLAVWNRIDGYDRSNPESFAASGLLTHLFPVDWEPVVPAAYGGSPLVWHRYARSTDSPEVNYILQRHGDAPPPSLHAGARLVADSAGYALWVRNDSIWASHRRLRPPTPAGSRWLAVPRSTLFRSVPAEPGAHVIDVVETLDALGLPMDAVLSKLGIHR